MDGQRFDKITKALVSGTSRRAVLRRLGAGLAGLGLMTGGHRVVRADRVMDVCAEFCRQLPEGRERGECVRKASQGTGPCYDCGPAATSANNVFCRKTQACVIDNCRFNQQGRLLFNPDTCACDCRPQYVENECGYCMVPCEPDGDQCPSGTCAQSIDNKDVCIVGSWAGACSPPNATCTSTADCCRCGINNVCMPDGYCRSPI
jgi:hypothetical protein